MWNWIVENWPYILSGICGVIFVASVIIKLTPSQKDDTVLGKIIAFIDHFSIVKTARDKQLIEYAEEVLNSKKKEAK